jgi:hypothetical protein
MKFKAGVFIEVDGEGDTEEEFRESISELIADQCHLFTVEYVVEDEEF